MRAHYPLARLYGDYVRAAIGTLFSAVPLIFAGDSTFVLVLFGSLFVLFAGFGIRTALHQLTTVELTTGALETHGPMRKRLPWNAIDKLELKYFSTRRDKNEGWMQLKVFGGGQCVKIESSIDRFEEIAAKVATVAKQNQAAMDPTTLENLSHMGLHTSSKGGGTA